MFPPFGARPSARATLSFQLDRPSVNIAGQYLLTLSADPACSDLPPEARRRTYDATIDASPYAPNTYIVVLSGATFLPFYDKLFASVAGDSARFDIDPYSDAVVTEELSASTALTFWGTSRATVGGLSVSVPFEGMVQYCAGPFSPQPTFPWVACGVPWAACGSLNHALTLSRR
jgi:hypothetical protein